jgi:hypothetical protein
VFGDRFRVCKDKNKVKIKCPACDEVVEIDPSMSGQIVDCSCGKKLRVPTVQQNPASSPSSAGDARFRGEDGSGPQQPAAPQGVNPAAGTATSEQNPFSTPSQGNPYAATNTPHANNPMMPPQGASQGLAITSLVLGIVSLVLMFTCCLGFLTAIPAVIFGTVAIKKANRGEAGGKGMAIAGVVLGGVVLALTALVVVFYGVMFALAPQGLGNAPPMFNP